MSASDAFERDVATALARLEDYLERAHAGFATDKRLHHEAEALSLAYTETRAIGADAAASVAYLAYFGPRAILAVAHAARPLDVRSVQHALDVGAGSGASALALLSLGARRVTLVDRSSKALTRARELLAQFGDRAQFALPHQGSQGRADVDLLASAFAFGELTAGAADAFASLRALAPAASRFVLVDAGDHDRARRIQEVRDVVAAHQAARDADHAHPGAPRSVAEQRLRIVGPCPHHDACPALVRERDWCHDRIAKVLPEKLTRFAAGVGRDAERMSLSWLALSSLAAPRDDALVVIGAPLVEKGRVRLPVCGPRGVRFLAALKRDRAAHAALRELERGARVPLEVVERGEANASGETVRVEAL